MFALLAAYSFLRFKNSPRKEAPAEPKKVSDPPAGQVGEQLPTMGLGNQVGEQPGPGDGCQASNGMTQSFQQIEVDGWLGCGFSALRMPAMGDERVSSRM
eukprot:Skav235122  [mRNA]  locus=scaffold3581:240057:240356:- [translate_table: standard]